MRIPALALIPALTATVAALADNWPAWRGGSGNGIAQETRLPLRWTANQNVRWRVPLPERGNSTPIVWGNRVFITQAVGDRRTVMCFDRNTGTALWQAGPSWTEAERTHEDNPPCSSSPTTDGERVVAWFGSAGVFSYDLEGKELWRRDLGRQSHQWGYAASPVLHGELCIVPFGPGERNFLIGLNKRTGRTLWQHDLPGVAAGAAWEELGGQPSNSNPPANGTVSEASGSWATPLVVRNGTREELILSCPLRVIALAPRTGQTLWTCGGPNIGVYSSPFFGDEVIGITANGFTNIVMAVRPGGQEEVSATHRLWCRTLPRSQASIGSGVIHDGHLYQMTYMGFAQCLELQTGQTVWEERLAGSGARHSSWSSPVLAGDRLYLPNQNADVFVVWAAPQFECLATNVIGGEPMNASLAVSDGAVFLRTHARLWCIAEAE